jgi:hypothetical protein
MISITEVVVQDMDNKEWSFKVGEGSVTEIEQSNGVIQINYGSCRRIVFTNCDFSLRMKTGGYKENL